jgi:ActR/RegA family two-component response regulator
LGTTRQLTNSGLKILTGYPDFDSAVEGIKSDVDGYLVKPADVEILLKSIQKKLAAKIIPVVLIAGEKRNGRFQQ